MPPRRSWTSITGVEPALAGAQLCKSPGSRRPATGGSALITATPDPTPMSATYHLKPTSDGQFMFNLKAANGEVILTVAARGIRSTRSPAKLVHPGGRVTDG